MVTCIEVDQAIESLMLVKEGVYAIAFKLSLLYGLKDGVRFTGIRKDDVVNAI